MTVTIQLNKSADERVMEQQIVLIGHAEALDDHTVTIKLEPGELAKLTPLVGDSERRLVVYAKAFADYQTALGKFELDPPHQPKPTPPDPMRGRPEFRYVDADRLIAWQLYWRGENYWSGDEI